MQGGARGVRQLLDELGVRPDRRRGQHFLVDRGVLSRQLAAAGIRKGDVVLEVGAGLGVLTTELAARAGRVVAYESDPALAEALGHGLPGNVELRRADALAGDWPPFDRMVSNVPYSISSPLLFRLLESDYDLAVLLLQREFADRLVAQPRSKDYGRLTVAAARLASVELLEVVPPAAFHPRPGVDSALVRIEPGESFAVEDPALLSELLRVAFSQRRKMLKNSLGGARQRLAPGAGAEEWASFLGDLWCARARPEELSPQELGALADSIHDLSTG